MCLSEEIDTEFEKKRLKKLLALLANQQADIVLEEKELNNEIDEIMDT